MKNINKQTNKQRDASSVFFLIIKTHNFMGHIIFIFSPTEILILSLNKLLARFI